MEKVQEIFAQLDDVIATQNEVIAKCQTFGTRRTLNTSQSMIMP